MVLKLSRIVSVFLFFSLFFFFSDISNKSKAVIAAYVYASESSHFSILENGIGYYVMAYSLEDISV